MAVLYNAKLQDSMITASLLQLGDVHYPDEISKIAADRKDGRFATTFAEEAAPNPLVAVMSTLVAVANRRDDLRGLAITGDLTHNGLVTGYSDCIAYLREGLSGLDVWANGDVIVVPGNHDVQRKSPDPFAQIVQLWTPDDWLVVNEVRTKQFELGPAKLSFSGMNSSFGCGQWWGVPEEIKPGLVAILENYEAEHGPTLGFDLSGERLDTPAFKAADIDAFMTHTHHLGPEWANVLVTHHALLPQALVRIALYTELLNGGLFRTRMLTAPTPVVYLHGHIHADPIEVIRSPSHPGQIVSVSAPKLASGFNLIEFMYSESGVLLGLNVVPFRNPGHGGVDPFGPSRHRFLDIETAHNACDEVDHELLERIGQTYVRFSAVQQLALGIPALDRDQLPDRLRKLYWCGLLRIENLESPPRHWHIRRVP